jgi:hypothetical protein
MNRIPPKGHPVATAAIPALGLGALGATCGELAARAVGVEAGTLDDATVWAWLMGASEAGAYCLIASKTEPRDAWRIIIPGKGCLDGWH